MTRNTLHVTAPGDREIVITRSFDAPRALVFEAMTKPELLRRWFQGPPGWTLTTCEIDARTGGTATFVWQNDDGRAMKMTQDYREVRAPERIVATERFDFGCETQAGEQLATMTFTEHGGRTTMTLTLVYPSKEARDGTVASGMEHGLAAGYDRIDDILAASAGA